MRVTPGGARGAASGRPGRLADEFAYERGDLLHFEEEAVVPVRGLDHPDVVRRGDRGRQFRLLGRRVEAVRVDTRDEGPGRHPAWEDRRGPERGLSSRQDDTWW